MGIKFLCDACGKKLNIKEELAGKKGRCPKCNAVIKIPAETTLDGSDKKVVETPPVLDEKKPVPKAKSSAQSSTRQLEKESAPPPVPAVTTGTEPETQSQTARKSNRKSQSKSVTATQPPDPDPPQPVSVPESETAPEPEPSQDVFAEHPNGRWFVRPVSGGQFGPAEPDVMKTWLKEGRVGRDSLVWCEGWEDWQNADEVFAEEFGSSSNSSEKKFVEEPNSKTAEPQPANRLVHHQAARKKAKTMGIVLVVGLALVSIALAVVLFIVVNNAKGGKNKDKKESANLSFEVEKNHNQSMGHMRL